MFEWIEPRLLIPSIFIPQFSGSISWIFPFNVSHSTILFKEENVAWIGLDEVANLAPPSIQSAIIVPETECISVNPSARVMWIKLIEETSRIRGAVIVFKEIEPSVVSAANRSTFQSASVMILPYWDERSNSPLKESGRKISIQVAGFTVSLRP